MRQFRHPPKRHRSLMIHRSEIVEATALLATLLQCCLVAVDFVGTQTLRHTTLNRRGILTVGPTPKAVRAENVSKMATMRMRQIMRAVDVLVWLYTSMVAITRNITNTTNDHTYIIHNSRNYSRRHRSRSCRQRKHNRRTTITASTTLNSPPQLRPNMARK